MLYDKKDIIDFLPQRDPFLFLDSITELIIPEHLQDLDPREFCLENLRGFMVRGSFLVKEDLPLLAGHFPGNPIFPGVLQIEAMAQASCFIIAPLFPNFKDVELELALGVVSRAKFRKPIFPGMQLEIHSQCTKVKGAVLSFKSQIYFLGELYAESSFVAHVNWKFRNCSENINKEKL